MADTCKLGETLKILDVIDQRLSASLVSIFLGISIVLAPVLKLIPFPVLFEVFLYMGIVGMNGVQFFDCVALCLMPSKHHP